MKVSTEHTSGGLGGWVRVCLDSLRVVLLGKALVDRSSEPTIWRMAEKMVRAHLHDGHAVVLDATNITVAHRACWVALAHELDLEPEIFLVETPLLACVERVLRFRHEHPVTPTVIERMAHECERPTCAEGRLVRCKLRTSARSPRSTVTEESYGSLNIVTRTGNEQFDTCASSRSEWSTSCRGRAPLL